VPETLSGITVVTEDFVADAHANAFAVHVWTINDEAQMRRLLDWGVDGVMTDRPTLLEKILRKRG
jgi:glycerophosphoryl diester phosphodiesterase